MPSLLGSLRWATLVAIGSCLSPMAGAQVMETEARLKAEIHGPSAIRFTLTGAQRPARPSEYRLTDGQGR